jgi:hypothetical protein
MTTYEFIDNPSNDTWDLLQKEDGVIVSAMSFSKGSNIVEVSALQTQIYHSADATTIIPNANIVAPSWTTIEDLYQSLETIVN